MPNIMFIGGIIYHFFPLNWVKSILDEICTGFIHLSVVLHVYPKDTVSCLAEPSRIDEPIDPCIQNNVDAQIINFTASGAFMIKQKTTQSLWLLLKNSIYFFLIQTILN